MQGGSTVIPTFSYKLAAFTLEVRTVYGRTVYSVMDSTGRTVSRSDNRTDALAIIAALSAQVAR